MKNLSSACWRLLGVGLLLMLASACGYHAAPGGEIDEDFSTVHVLMFSNKTLEPFLEARLTDALISEFQRGGRYDISEERAGADLLLAGEVVSYRSVPLAYAPDDTIALYQLSIMAQATLRQRQTGRVVWRGEASWRDAYPKLEDKRLQRDAEETAARVVVERLAEHLYAQLLERF